MQPPPPPDKPPSPGGYVAFPPPPPGGFPPPPPPPPTAPSTWQPPAQAAGAYGYPAQPYGYAPQPYPYVPEGYVQVQFAGFWIRVVAYFIDGVILNLISFALGFVLGLVAAFNDPSGNTTQSTSFQLLLYGVILLINMAYFVWRWSVSGATIGQRILGLRVVDATTLQPIGVGTAFLRWIGMLVSFLVCYLGVIWVAFDGRKQGWHDKMANSLVIKG